MTSSIRSWTDLLSNVTHMGGVHLADHLDDFVRSGGAPPDLIMSCFHEFTHHWCFYSSLGLAITGLTCRMARSTLSADHGRGETVRRDLEAHRAITAALRPLSEGMALFAEFDVITLKSPVWSRPLGWTTLLFSGRAASIQTPSEFGGGLEPDASEIAELLAASLPVVVDLRQARVSDIGVKRKVNVLAMSTRDDADGYAVGYLGVKGMYRALRQQVPLLYRESDLALAYLKSFFYEDRVLIDILLCGDKSTTSFISPSEDVQSLSRKIMRRIGARMAELSDVTEDDIDKFQTLMLHQEPMDSSAWASCLHLTASEWECGQRAYDEVATTFTSDSVGEQPGETFDEKLSREVLDGFSLMVSRRHIVHLGSQAVTVSVDAAGAFTAHLGDRELITGKAFPGVPPQSGEGSIELLFSAQSQVSPRVVAVWGPESVVAAVIPGNVGVEPGELELIGYRLKPAASFFRFGDATGRLVDSFAQQAGISQDVEIYQIGLSEAIRYTYLDSALNSVEDDDLFKVVAILDEGGVYAVLDYNRDLLEALVVIGAIAPTTPLRNLVSQELIKQGFTDPDATLNALVDQGMAAGFPVLRCHDVYVNPLV
jgi:hypothetical protein